MTKGPPTGRSLPFDVAAEVAALVGDQELRLLARQAAAGPFECAECGRDGTAARGTAAAVAIRARRTARDDNGSTSPESRELTLLRLAHTTCLRSQVINSDEVLESGDAAVNVSTAMLARHGVPRPLLLLDFVSGVSAPTGPDGRSDLLITMLLEDGMTLVSDIHSPLPHASSFSVRIRRGKLSVQCQGSKPLIEEMRVIEAPGWRKAVKDHGEVTILAGTALGVHAGFDGLAEAVRAGRVAGALVSVSS